MPYFQANIGPKLQGSHEKSQPEQDYQSKTQSKFKRLNAESINTGIIGRIRQLIGFIMLHLRMTPGFAWMTHMSAEHMSKGVLSGNMSHDATSRTIELLKKIDDAPGSGQSDFGKVIEQLNYAKQIQRKKLQCYPFSVLANQLKKKVSHLKVGESIAIPSDTWSHAMMMSITCTMDENNKKIYTIHQYNEGAGIEKYHYSKIDKNGKRSYQVAIEITNIDHDSLCGKDAHFLKDVLKNSSIDKLYTTFIPQLKGKILPPSEDERLWSHGQLGGSCTFACAKALLRAQLDATTYKKFRTLGRTEALLKSYREIKRGWANNNVQKLVSLEIVKRLESSLVKQKKEVPDHIKVVKKQLESSLAVKSKSAETKKAVSPTVISSLQEAFKKLKAGNFSQQSILRVHSDLESALKLAASSGSLDPKQYQAFIKNAIDVMNFCKGRPLTSEQTYLMTVLSCVILEVIIHKKNDKGLKEKRLQRFAFEMHHRYNGLKLSMPINESYDSVIEHYQKRMFKDVGIIVPKGMADMIKNSRPPPPPPILQPKPAKG